MWESLKYTCIFEKIVYDPKSPKKKRMMVYYMEYDTDSGTHWMLSCSEQWLFYGDKIGSIKDTILLKIVIAPQLVVIFEKFRGSI